MNKIIFRTNIDAYKTNCFPINLTHLPRKGDLVSVVEVFGRHYIDKGLPTSLEVKSILHTERGVLCELNFSKTQLEAYKLSGVNPYNIR